MKRKSAWYSIGALLLGLALLSMSCALIEPPAPAPPVARIIPPTIPHLLEGRADCRLCHATGAGGAPQFPPNHSQRPSDVCLACHQPASAQNGGTAPAITPMPPVTTTPPTATAPTAVLAKELFTTKCAACHGVNRQGVPGLAPALTPESLSGRNDTEIRNTILDGRSGTAMPAFKATLSSEEIDALLQLIKSPP